MFKGHSTAAKADRREAAAEDTPTNSSSLDPQQPAPPPQPQTLPDLPPEDALPEDPPETVTHYSDDQPTASHQLADAAAEKPYEEKGYAEVNHGEVEVKNLGWNSDHPDHVPNPLVGGLSNEDLWVLVRRFDKQLFQVKSIPEAPLGELDLNIAEEESFSPEKLRAQIERLYMTIIVGAFAFWKQIVRLRSWRETRRTSAFLGVYALAWALDLLVPVIVSFLIVLVLHAPSGAYCFPPAPPALIGSATGGVM